MPAANKPAAKTTETLEQPTNADQTSDQVTAEGNSDQLNQEVQTLQARLEEAQHEIERLKADAPSKDSVTIAKGCNYSVGYVRSCEVLKNSEGEAWAIKMPVGFTVGANINLLDQSIPADADPTWKNVPITPSGKNPFFVYRKEDFMELKALIDNSEFLTLALQWKHKWNNSNTLIKHPKTADRGEWIGLKHPAENQIIQYTVLNSVVKNEEEIPF
tara:strand:+ start:269 stop:916 length:648 start_codon:yes stop_codon:yes gene_type:complete